MARPGSNPGKIGQTHDLQKPEIRPNFSSSHILSNGYTAKIGPNTNSREQVCAHCGQILAATLIGYQNNQPQDLIGCWNQWKLN